MKILIAYTSKNGTTADCVSRLSEQLQGLDVTVAELTRETPDVSDFDLVLVGGSVRYARLSPALMRFFKEQKHALLSKRLAIFLTCGIAHEYEYYEETLIPKELRAHAFSVLYFGGTLRTDGLPFLDRFVVRSLRSRIAESEINDGEYTPSLPGILPENIERLATYTRREIELARNQK
jgi:menaquinone-dependent protoporphyrinogen oxidase